jgi:hypothetical protein
MRTRLMVCANGDGAHHEGSDKRVGAWSSEPKAFKADWSPRVWLLVSKNEYSGNVNE